jgi:23S rRNA (cytosine1962-C5)-methyltransferase
MQEIAKNWKDYECLDAGNGYKLERWKDVILSRPESHADWSKNPKVKEWKDVHAHYQLSNGKGDWQFNQTLPETWNIQYKDLTFKVSPTSFKHTGLFPEQAANWDWMRKLIEKEDREIRILNLFAYTGGATMACSKAGASEVVHVDASKGMIAWAKENQQLCGLEDHKIRYIVDDVLKFVEREKRRGRTYHGILMDPPSFGRGPKGELWKFEKQIIDLIDSCKELLDDDPLFFLVNAYTLGFSDDLLYKDLKFAFNKAKVVTGEIGLPITNQDKVLPCGIFGRVSFK